MLKQSGMGDSAPSGTTPLSSGVLRMRFSSHDEIVDAIRDVNMEAFILRREHRPWELSQFSLGSSLVQYGVDGAAHGSAGRIDPHRVAYYLSDASTSLRNCNGQEIDSGQAFRWGPNAEFGINTRRAGDWFAVMLDPEAIARAVAAMTCTEPLVLKFPPAAATASPVRVARFRTLLFESMDAVAGAGPSGLAPHAARRLEETLTWEAVRLFVEGRPAPRAGRPRRDRARILFEIESLLESRPDEPVYLSTLCEALAMPERTLRHFFDEQFGLSPVRVLRCRRLCQVREALLAAPFGARVSDIAGAYGFWHMGQFAADYRKLFGVRPSETLRQKLPSRLSPDLAARRLTGLPQN